MALQSPFFNNKRESEATQLRNALSPNAQAAAGVQATQTPQSAPVAPAAQGAPAPAAATQGMEGESKLTVGPNIKLKGVEIKDCDTLVVEGSVEATMDSRLMRISERGTFKGSAEIDIAEIHGQFDGTLTVRKKLTIYSTGKVTGHVRYPSVVIEEGGQLSGEIVFGNAAQKPAAGSPARQGLQTVHSAVG